MNAAAAIRQAFEQPGPAPAAHGRRRPLWGNLPGARSAPVVLAGDLAAFPPADVLQMLHRGRRSGLLVASCGPTQRAFVFANGDLAWAGSSEAAERIEGGLRDQIGAVLSAFLEMKEGVFSMRGFNPGEALEAGALNTEEMLLRSMQLFDEDQR